MVDIAASAKREQNRGGGGGGGGERSSLCPSLDLPLIVDTQVHTKHNMQRF